MRARSIPISAALPVMNQGLLGCFCSPCSRNNSRSFQFRAPQRLDSFLDSAISAVRECARSASASTRAVNTPIPPSNK